MSRTPRLATSLLALAALLAPAPSRADFGEIRRVTAGTAYTYERGEFAVGVLGPLEYGVVDELTLTTHPVLHLLLTPNVAAKWKFLDLGAVAMSMSVGYIQTFLDRDVFPGSAAFFPMLTVPIGKRVSLTAQGGYLLDIGPTAHGATFGGGVAVLASTADLVRVLVQEEWYRDVRGFSRPTVLVTYTRAFYQLRLTAGVAIGRFPIQVGNTPADVQEWPAYPIVDVWWQL
ncbi:MAG: hypothetical protein FJ087_12130 [Deltaproteobacteria bacterium]|nr:hypothetical protein [Deltaproteobacteria bacterium]